MTPAGGRGQLAGVAFDKRRLRREIEKERRARLKARLGELRGLIQDARRARDAAIAAVRADCRQKRAELKAACDARRCEAKDAGNRKVAARKAELATERSFEAQIARAAGPVRARSSSRERRQESDDEVRANIPADMIRVFDAVRKRIKGGPRKTRTEAFMEWAEENPGEVFDLLQHDADRYLAQLLAEQERTARELKRGALAGVPF